MRYYDKDWAHDAGNTGTGTGGSGGSGGSGPTGGAGGGNSGPGAVTQTHVVATSRGMPAWLKAVLGLLVVAVLGGIAWALWGHPSGPPADPLKGTVFVLTPGGSGSGVILSADGVVLTNKHVIMNGNVPYPADQILIRVNSGSPSFKDYRVEKLETSDETEYGTQEAMSHDWAMLKLKNASNLPALSIGLSHPDQLKRESEVRAIGFPHVTLTEIQRKQDLKNGPPYDDVKGFVSSFVPDDTKPYCIVNTCPLQQGDSGGPLLNAKGEVVGINTQSVPDKAGNHRSLSIAIHMLEKQLESQKIPFPK